MFPSILHQNGEGFTNPPRLPSHKVSRPLLCSGRKRGACPRATPNRVVLSAQEEWTVACMLCQIPSLWDPLLRRRPLTNPSGSQPQLPQAHSICPCSISIILTLCLFLPTLFPLPHCLPLTTPPLQTTCPTCSKYLNSICCNHHSPPFPPIGPNFWISSLASPAPHPLLRRYPRLAIHPPSWTIPLFSFRLPLIVDLLARNPSLILFPIWAGKVPRFHLSGSLSSGDKIFSFLLVRKRGFLLPPCCSQHIDSIRPRK